MLRILSWSSGLGCDKMHNPDYSMFVPKQQSAPVADFPLTTTMKRKRSPSCDARNVVAKHSIDQGDSQCIQAATQKPVEATIKPELSLSINSPDSITSSTMADILPADRTAQKSPESRLKYMRQTISSQLSLEILLKHKELRLIDQEIAKCQVALEQLRRCSEIPYPGTQIPSTLVSEGKGAALKKSGQQNPAKSPAPWGVTDGPYSRHYAKWLLPDARFDGGESEIQLRDIMDAAVPARSTRGSFVEAGKSLKSRSTIRSGNLQSLPAGYGQPKEKATGPMILKRKSDNAMVKLVCPDCGRHDFGSAQGFINHCRIGHGRSFASHDAAAEACGEAVEYNNNGTIKGVEPVTTPTATNMHPLIRSAKLLSQTPTSIPSSTNVTNPKSRRARKSEPSTTSPDFLASTQTPHLSALVKSQGLGLNLQDLVTDAKKKVELPDSDNEDDEMDVDSPLPTNSGRHPQVAGSKQPMKSTSSKKHSSPLLHSRTLFVQNMSGEPNRALQEQSHLTMPGDQIHPDFMHPPIPSPTNESTQAPSLVDDDEEFDPQSPPSSDEIDEAEIDFDIQDDEHGERAVLRDGGLPSPQTTCAPGPPARTHARRPSAIRRSLGSRGGNKNVSFASPSPLPEGSDRKRRKMEGN